MAAVREYWLDENKKNTTVDHSLAYFYKSCIFQQQWNEQFSRFRNHGWHCSIPVQHADYLTRLLLDSLLGSDYKTAARCLMALCGHAKKVPELLWRTGYEVLRKLKGNHARMVQFFKYIFMLCHPYQEEILMDFAMFLVKEQHEIREAYELMSGKSACKPFEKNMLMKAYMGMFEWTLWKTKRLKLQLSDSVEIESSNVNLDQHFATGSCKQVDYHGNKAMKLLMGLVDCEGVWDVFIPKQIEILLHYGQCREARKILEKYKEKNPENPNSHRYMYYFQKKEDDSASQIMATLRKLFIADPTSELIAEYRQLVESSKSEDSESIYLLFDKLDHSTCRDSLNDWKALADVLHTCYHSNPIDQRLVAAITNCWEERAEWWPQYHFQENQLYNAQSKVINDVIIEKCRVAIRLLSEDNSFVKAVKRQKKIQGKRFSFLEQKQTGGNTKASSSERSSSINSAPRTVKRKLRQRDTSSSKKRKRSRVTEIS